MGGITGLTLHSVDREDSAEYLDVSKETIEPIDAMGIMDPPSPHQNTPIASANRS